MRRAVSSAFIEHARTASCWLFLAALNFQKTQRELEMNTEAVLNECWAIIERNDAIDARNVVGQLPACHVQTDQFDLFCWYSSSDSALRLSAVLS